MTAIAFEVPEEIRGATERLVEFAEREVLSRHQQHGDLLENPRLVHREDGRLSDEVVELIRQVRVAAAREGHYQLCVPEHLGGGGFGHLAYYFAWQALFHRCGPRNWLMRYALCAGALGLWPQSAVGKGNSGGSRASASGSYVWRAVHVLWTDRAECGV